LGIRKREGKGWDWRGGEGKGEEGKGREIRVPKVTPSKKF